LCVQHLAKLEARISHLLNIESRPCGVNVRKEDVGISQKWTHLDMETFSKNSENC